MRSGQADCLDEATDSTVFFLQHFSTSKEVQYNASYLVPGLEECAHNILHKTLKKKKNTSTLL